MIQYGIEAGAYDLEQIQRLVQTITNTEASGRQETRPDEYISQPSVDKVSRTDASPGLFARSHDTTQALKKRKFSSSEIMEVSVSHCLH